MPSFIHPGTLWRDTRGHRIRAHGAGILTINATFGSAPLFVWYGADHYRQPNHTKDHNHEPPNRKINAYSSRDLTNWEPHGTVFEMACEALNIAHGCYVDRPKVLATSTNRYVMWLKSTPFVAVATSGSPFGPFKLRGRWKPGGLDVGDIGACYDGSTRRSFLAYSVKPSSTPNATRVVHIARLDEPDLTNISEVVSTIPFAREAPAPFAPTGAGRYFVWTSRPSGWYPNAAELFSAPSMRGPWKSEGNPTRSPDSFSSQVSFILPLPRTRHSFVYVADRFAPWINTSESGRYVWLPAELVANASRGGSPSSPVVRIVWRDHWKVPRVGSVIESGFSG